jgi:hypothetical protein
MLQRRKGRQRDLLTVYGQRAANVKRQILIDQKIFHIIFSENAKTLSASGKGFTCYKLNNSLSSFDLAGAETTRANRYGLVCSVNNGANLSDVGFPGSACFTVGVRNIVSESNTFTAAHTFCHILHLPRKIRTICT